MRVHTAGDNAIAQVRAANDGTVDAPRPSATAVQHLGTNWDFIWLDSEARALKVAEGLRAAVAACKG